MIIPRALDIIGDIHGEFPALKALGRRLGYDVDGGWTHPTQRFLIFLGDLVDRGAYSLEVAELVRALVEQRRALCIMGNHEYNLVAFHLKVPGYAKPKKSNGPTIRAIQADPVRWEPVLRFLRDLPVGINLPDLRLIHACWHRQSLDGTELLRCQPSDQGEPEAADTMTWISRHVSLRSPFGEGGLLPGLPAKPPGKDEDAPHEILMKGFEEDAPALFLDNDGTPRGRIRATWWKNRRHLVLTDKAQVFGHYWNVPPVDGDFAPPFPSGHQDLRDWSTRMLSRWTPEGSKLMEGDFACVDFHGITRASSHRACIGALRWPEREIVWASDEKTAINAADD